MLRRTIRKVSEFENKSWRDRFPRVHGYGDGPSPGVAGQRRMGRITWLKCFKIQTKESNRLSNREGRYAHYFDELQAEKTLEDSGVAKDDIRLNDIRPMWWKCPDCKTIYKKQLGQRMKYASHCPRCTLRYPSVSIGEQSQRSKEFTLGKAHPELLKEISPEEDKAFIASLDITSPFKAKWNCRKCGDEFTCSVRQRTGAVDDSGRMTRLQEGFEPSLVEFCKHCTWRVRMYRVGRMSQASGSFLGFEDEVLVNMHSPYRASNSDFRTEVPPPPPKEAEAEA